MQDEIDEVLQLVAQPLKARHNLLSGECKFVLNSSVLYKINKALDVVFTDSVDIILTEWQRRQLQLLMNVINNTPKLVITQRSPESSEHVINISKFKRLRYLELCRLCLEMVVGLEPLKIQLETFICNRCTKYSSFLCKRKELEWPELKFLDLRHMRLDSTDSRFFISKPWIQNLDLSFNRLTTIEGLEYLDHLTVLNVSYNHLTKIPELSKEAEKRLEIFILNNNHLSSLSGLQNLSALEFLFVNSNFISNKSELYHLSNLKSLCSLHIQNNPISATEFWNIYVVASLSREVNSKKFLINNRLLNSRELQVFGKQFGTCRHYQPVDINPPLVSNEQAVQEVSKYRRPGKRISKPREVVIEDIPSDGIVEEPQQEKNYQKSSKQSEDINFVSQVFSENLENETAKENEDELIGQLGELENVIVEGRNHSSLPRVASALKEKVHILDEPVILSSEKVVDSACQDSDIETTTMLISATVHAPDSLSVDSRTNLDSSGLIDLEIEKSIKEEYSLESGESSKEANNDLVEVQNNFIQREMLAEKHELQAEKYTTDVSKGDQPGPPSIFDDSNLTLNTVVENKNGSSSDPDSITKESVDISDDSLSDAEDEVLWQVQSHDKVSGKVQNIILVLLEDELKERSTETGRTTTRWPLEKIMACTKTKIDPVTIEIEFDTTRKDKRFRNYVMEYPDAQVLLKKVYAVLESKPLSSMNQKTYECIKCGSFFVRSAPGVFRSRETLISCAVCSSTLVIEVEEPKLPEAKPQTQGISLSSSQSSIGNGIILGEESACKEWISSCSAASLEQNNFIDRRFSAQRYESDIEVISNPSQSSIEVLGEHSRSVTPRRKTSAEEKTGAVPISTQLTTVMESTSPQQNLTESSSSGSLTESVITAYEAFNNNKKTIIPEGALAEEESSPTSEPDPPSDIIKEERPTSVWRKDSNIYSFTDFTDVDPRIKLFLYQKIFKDDNETLLLLVRCHLWKTGGSDFDGCAVFTTSKVYLLSHSRTNFRQDECDWLTLFDSFNLKDVKDISPLIWSQGARVQFKNFSYLILLMDPNRTGNFMKHIKGFLKGIKIQNYPSTSTELCLQQAVLLSSSIESSVDPSINAFTICLSITMLKDNVETDIFRLSGLILTCGEFHIIAGEMSWLITSTVPSVLASQQMSNLMEVGRGMDIVELHFLDQTEAVEEVWQLKLVSKNHVSFLIDSIKVPWEEMFSECLDVTNRG